MKMIMTLIIFLLLLGCEGSLMRNINHPDRQVVTVNGYDISVVPMSDGTWVAWYSETGITPSLALLKPAQIEAIETVSGCSVTTAEYDHGSLLSAYLEAAVKCR